MIDTTEQVYHLIKQWCFTRDQSRANEALRQIAIITKCIPEVPDQLTQKQGKVVVEWLQKNQPNTYLWAMSQLSMGHPAGVWGMGFNSSSHLAMPKNASSL